MIRALRPFVRTSVGTSVFLAAIVMAAVTSGCAVDRPYVWIENLPPTTATGPGVIHARDSIVVAVRDQPALSGEFVVRDDGGVLLPTLGDVRVEGTTAAQLSSYLATRLTNVVVKPEVTVSLTRAAPIRVNVIGEVKTPGSYELIRDHTVASALAAAGWLNDFASKDRIFVVPPVPGEPRVRFHVRDITGAEPNATRFRLHDGDVVVVE
jgi:hypothetical protein